MLWRSKSKQISGSKHTTDKLAEPSYRHHRSKGEAILMLPHPHAYCVAAISV